jgi:hypothetical protein
VHARIIIDLGMEVVGRVHFELTGKGRWRGIARITEAARGGEIRIVDIERAADIGRQRDDPGPIDAEAPIRRLNARDVIGTKRFMSSIADSSVCYAVHVWEILGALRPRFPNK